MVTYEKMQRETPKYVVWDFSNDQHIAYIIDGIVTFDTLSFAGRKDFSTEKYKENFEGIYRFVSDLKEEWFLDGILHRETGPARTYSNGTKEWRYYGQMHRNPYDGPAYSSETGIEEFWVEDTHFDSCIAAMKFWDNNFS